METTNFSNGGFSSDVPLVNAVKELNQIVESMQKEISEWKATLRFSESVPSTHKDWLKLIMESNAWRSSERAV